MPRACICPRVTMVMLCMFARLEGSEMEKEAKVDQSREPCRNSLHIPTDIWADCFISTEWAGHYPEKSGFRTDEKTVLSIIPKLSDRNGLAEEFKHTTEN